VVAGVIAPRAMCVVIAAVVAITAAVTVIGVPESAALPGADPATARVARSHPVVALRAYVGEFARYPDFCWVVLSRFLMLTGLAGIQRFAANYIRDTYAGHYTLFGWDLGSAQTATSVMFAIIILFGLLVTYPAVRISDRVGRRRTLVAAGFCGAGGALLFFLASSLSQVVLFAVLVAVCFGTFVSVDWAFMADLAPRGRAGKFLGFSNLATAGAQAAAPAVLGPVIDVVNRGTSNTGGYRVLFLVAAFFFIIGALVLSRTRAERIADVDDDAATRTATTAASAGR
jgi:MFS family permease